jgi:hypothetical protein
MDAQYERNANLIYENLLENTVIFTQEIVVCKR